MPAEPESKQPTAELTCTHCGCDMDYCSFCDESGCGVAICYGCMVVAIGQTTEALHTHGG
ncbi:MAG: hypothetical protein E6G44_07740 [Actinobacteria bacterium]|nr:MAG: hypothetical protein E6G44_07740 [Actinomycetota bacterium]